LSGPIRSPGAISLVAGRKYNVEMWYYENTGSAVARLSWAYPGQAKVVIPRSRLYPTWE
jgi:hypothetical protein